VDPRGTQGIVYVSTGKEKHTFGSVMPVDQFFQGREVGHSKIMTRANMIFWRSASFVTLRLEKLPARMEFHLWLDRGKADQAPDLTEVLLLQGGPVDAEEAEDRE